MKRMQLALLAAVVLGTAGCQISVVTGVVSGLLALGTGLAFVLLGSASQTGCSGVIGPCLSIVAPEEVPNDRVPDARVPDAQLVPLVPPPDPPLSVCLSPLPPPTDAGVPRPDAHMGPCLSIAPPRKHKKVPTPPEAPLHICLSEMEIHPCLRMAPDPRDPDGAQNTPKSLDEAAVLARVMDRLPPDVAARLRRPT